MVVPSVPLAGMAVAMPAGPEPMPGRVLSPVRRRAGPCRPPLPGLNYLRGHGRCRSGPAGTPASRSSTAGPGPARHDPACRAGRRARRAPAPLATGSRPEPARPRPGGGDVAAPPELRRDRAQHAEPRHPPRHRRRDGDPVQGAQHAGPGGRLCARLRRRRAGRAGDAQRHRSARPRAAAARAVPGLRAGPQLGRGDRERRRPALPWPVHRTRRPSQATQHAAPDVRPRSHAAVHP